MRDYSLHRNLTPTRPSKTSKIVLLLFILAAIGFGYSTLRKPSSITTSATIKKTEENSSNFFPKINNSSVEDFINKDIPTLLSQESGTYAIYIYDIKNKKEYGLREKTVMTAASVNKIPILAALYHLAGKREIDLEKVIVTQPDDIQDYGTGSIRYESPGKPYSLKTLARLMMEKSDNTAAFILASHVVGIEKIQTLVDSWGLLQTNIADNSSSPYDIGQLLLKMYNGDVTNHALTLEMLEFMRHSDFEDRIPTGVPSDVKIYHKTGDEVAKIHDAGIIEKINHPYILTIFTSDVIDETRTKSIMAEISKHVFNAL